MHSADVDLLTDLAPAPAPEPPVPEGWDARLPAGVTRRIRVRRARVGIAGGAPWVVCAAGGFPAHYEALLIEGPVRCVHDAEEHLAQIETEASILVRN